MGRHRNTSDEELLAVARAVFAREGHAASTREIAQRAGVSQAILFQRFGTKDRLFREAMLPAPPDAVQIVGDLAEVEVLGARGHLEAIVGRLLAWLLVAMPALVKFLAWPDAGPELLAEAHRRFHGSGLPERLAERIQLLQARGLLRGGDPRPVIELLVGTAHTAAFMRTAGAGPAALDGHVERVMATLWVGLAPDRPKDAPLPG